MKHFKDEFSSLSSNVNSYQEVISHCIPVMSWWCFISVPPWPVTPTEMTLFVSGSGPSLHVTLSPILKGPFSKKNRDLSFGNYQEDITNVRWCTGSWCLFRCFLKTETPLSERKAYTLLCLLELTWEGLNYIWEELGSSSHSELFQALPMRVRHNGTTLIGLLLIANSYWAVTLF